MFCTMMPLTSSTLALTRWILEISPGLFMQYSMWYLRRGENCLSKAPADAVLAFSPCLDLNSVCTCGARVIAREAGLQETSVGAEHGGAQQRRAGRRMTSCMHG